MVLILKLVSVDYYKKERQYTITFFKNKNGYKTRTKRFTYSENTHGPFTKFLAMYTAKTGKRLYHWFVTDGIYTSVFIYNKTYGIKRMLIDNEFIDIVRNHKINIVKNKTGQDIFYAIIKMNGRNIHVHRLIMGLGKYNNDPVDHIFHDSLDNRRLNLRICTPSINNRNSRLRVDNKSGIQGVYFSKHRKTYIAEVRDLNGKKIRKHFKIKHNGREKAIELAKQWRDEMVEEYYERKSAAKPEFQERSTTIKSMFIINIKI